jgi:hypothetical protein
MNRYALLDTKYVSVMMTPELVFCSGGSWFVQRGVLGGVEWFISEM